MPKIKTAFIVNDLGLGGVQSLTVQFANLLDETKFDVALVTLLSGPESFFYREEVRRGLKHHSFSFKNFFDFREWFAFYKFMRKEKYDIIFTQLFMADTVGRATAFLAGTPVIVTEIQNIIPNLPKKFILVDRLLAKVTNACLSTAAAVTDYAVSTIGFPRKKIIEIPTNAVNTARFQVAPERTKFRRELGIPEGAKIVVNVGRLVGQKGQTILLKAARIILARRRDVYFLIVGSGKLEEKLKKEAQGLGLADKVKFLGARKDLPYLLINSDIFAFPSLWEGQGLVLFDAIFSKIPIVASRTGGIPEVVEHEVTGLLEEPGDHEALAGNIMRILDDEGLGRALASRAYERFKDRTMENSVKKLEEVFITLYNSRRD